MTAVVTYLLVINIRELSVRIWDKYNAKKCNLFLNPIQFFHDYNMK